MSHTTPAPIFDNLDYFPTPLGLTFDCLEKFENLPANSKDDYRYAYEFLYSYRGSQATFNSYRREIERLLHWSWRVAKKSLIELNRTDFEMFLEFCQKPPEAWIGLKNVTRFISLEGLRKPNPDWRPFVATVTKKAHRSGEAPSVKQYRPSQNALQAIFAILGSFYNFLIQEEYTEKNPVAQIRQKSKFLRKTQGEAPIRRLSELQWAYVIETAEKLADQNPELYERTLFIMNALFALYLRISELGASKRWEPQMGDFYSDLDGNWWFKTVGKGNKVRSVAVSDAMLKALQRYRKSLGLTNFPSPGENSPLIHKTRGTGAIHGTRHIRKIVQHCFDTAVEQLIKDGFEQDADLLMSATVHWLRHTGISEDVKRRPREHVRDDAGHGSGAITDRYIDIEMRERHASSKKKQIKPE